jgi:hypothetical protein
VSRSPPCRSLLGYSWHGLASWLFQTPVRVPCGIHNTCRFVMSPTSCDGRQVSSWVSSWVSLLVVSEREIWDVALKNMGLYTYLDTVISIISASCRCTAAKYYSVFDRLDLLKTDRITLGVTRHRCSGRGVLTTKMPNHRSLDRSCLVVARLEQ